MLGLNNNFWLGTSPLPKNGWDIEQIIQTITKLNGIEEFQKQIHCQLFNPIYYLSNELIARVLSHVQRTFSLQSNVSNQPSVEFLRYLTAERQIGKAFQLAGIKSIDILNPSNSINLIIFGDKFLDPKVIQSIQNELLPFGLNFTQIKQDLSVKRILELQSVYQISEARIWRIIKCDQEYISSTQLHSLSELDQLPISLLLHAFEDAINEKMVWMYVDNNKR